MSIWKFEQLSESIPQKYQLTLNEGNTNTYKLYLNKQEQKELGVKDPEKSQVVYLKLETMNPNKSFKDRSLAYQVSYYYSQGAKKLLISSSGNAGVSAAAYTSLTDMKLAVFVSNHVNEQKLEKLNYFVNKNENITLHFSKRPKSDAIKYAKAGNFINLRGSEDDEAAVGFQTIAYELFEELPDIDAFFIPCSSGTSTVGIAEGYKVLGQKVPAVHVCQSTKIHPIAKEYDVLFEPTKDSIADAIADRVAKRKNEVVDLIKESKGSGWILSDEEIQKSLDFLKRKTPIIDLTPNGTLSFAGFVKSLQRRKYYYQKPVCIISGI